MLTIRIDASMNHDGNRLVVEFETDATAANLHEEALCSILMTLYGNAKDEIGRLAHRLADQKAQLSEAAVRLKGETE